MVIQKSPPQVNEKKIECCDHRTTRNLYCSKLYLKRKIVKLNMIVCKKIHIDEKKKWRETLKLSADMHKCKNYFLNKNK